VPEGGGGRKQRTLNELGLITDQSLVGKKRGNRIAIRSRKIHLPPDGRIDHKGGEGTLVERRVTVVRQRWGGGGLSMPVRKGGIERVEFDAEREDRRRNQTVHRFLKCTVTAGATMFRQTEERCRINKAVTKKARLY